MLGFVPRIVLASLAGFLVGQLLNAWVLVRIKDRTLESRLWVRLLGSSAVGELADTVVFCTIAFYGVITGWTFLNYVVTGYLWKVSVEVLVLPVTYRVIAAVKRREPTYGAPPRAGRRPGPRAGVVPPEELRAQGVEVTLGQGRCASGRPDRPGTPRCGSWPACARRSRRS